MRDDRMEAERRAEQARMVEQRRKEGLKKLAKEEKDARRMDGVKSSLPLKDDRTVKQGINKLRKWFGVETESGSETSSDTDSTDTDDWNQVDRKKKNKTEVKIAREE